MMLHFTFEPNVGPLPLRFGMTPAQVDNLLGPPSSVTTSHFGNRNEWRINVNAGFSNDSLLQEVVFTPGSFVTLFGHDLFAEPDLIAILKLYDPDPQLFVGFVVFDRLGICLSGFRAGDDETKAITFVPIGHYDRFANDFVPFQV